MTADPFSPGGVVFRPVSGNLVTVRLISAGLSLGIPLLALAALAVWVGKPRLIDNTVLVP